MTVGPCIHPRCDDGTGNAALTTQTMCDPCRRHYRRQLDWIALDYVTIKTQMPRPTSSGRTRGARPESFGHPAEWASDTCRDIAQMLNEGEDSLRAHLHQGQAPNLYTAAETTQVESAYAYLSLRFDDVCVYPDAAVLVLGIHETHRTIRSALGYTRLAQKLPVPCPSCDVAALVRSVGSIGCGNCGRSIREDQYGMFTRIAVDYLIDSYDALKAEELA